MKRKVIVVGAVQPETRSCRMESCVPEDEVRAIWKTIKGIPCPFRGVRAKFIRKNGEIFVGKLVEKKGSKGNTCALMFSNPPVSCFAENGNTPCLGSCGRFNHSGGRRVIAKIMFNFIVFSPKLNGGKAVPALEWLEHITSKKNP